MRILAIIGLQLCCFVLLQAQQVQSEFIQGPWQFREVGTSAWHNATVPGSIHTDLLANKMIPDPFIDTNERAVQWVETKDWEYRCSFHPADQVLRYPNVDLVLDGLNTYADIYFDNQQPDMLIQIKTLENAPVLEEHVYNFKQGIIPIDISTQPDGFYMIYISAKDGKASKKIKVKKVG